MAWKIDSYDSARDEGTIVSPHIGPLTFGEAQNVMRTLDFAVGEEVYVELTRTPAGWAVEEVMPARPREPEGTQDPVFAEVNGHWDGRVEHVADGELRVWAGDCCEFCHPFSYVTFTGVAAVVSSLEEDGLNDPRFRMASEQEIAALSVPVPPAHRVFCVVSEGDGPTPPCIFVIARDVHVTHHALRSREAR